MYGKSGRRKLCCFGEVCRRCVKKCSNASVNLYFCRYGTRINSRGNGSKGVFNLYQTGIDTDTAGVKGVDSDLFCLFRLGNRKRGFRENNFGNTAGITAATAAGIVSYFFIGHIQQGFATVVTEKTKLCTGYAALYQRLDILGRHIFKFGNAGS